MKRPAWLNRKDCLAIHEMMLSYHGGLAGVRDEGLLDSALAKAQHLFEYATPTLPEMAARYAAGIILNHPFLEGNKRTGFMLAATFLELNGISFTATEEAVVANTLALANGALSPARHAKWLTENSRKT